jgi:broad specificity phosphatase PhoE
LRRQKLWEIVQEYPSRVQFPGGESIRQAQTRAVEALERLVTCHPQHTVVVVSHSDIIKLIVVYYLGAHLDFYQRLEISPTSLTIIRLGAARPFIIRVNDTSHLPYIRPESRSTGLWFWVQKFAERLRLR